MLIAKKPTILLKSLSAVSLLVLLQNNGYTQETSYLKNIKEGVTGLIKPKDDQSFRTVQLKDLTDFKYQPDAHIGNQNQLPVVKPYTGQKASLNNLYLEQAHKQPMRIQAKGKS